MEFYRHERTTCAFDCDCFLSNRRLIQGRVPSSYIEASLPAVIACGLFLERWQLCHYRIYARLAISSLSSLTYISSEENLHP